MRQDIDRREILQLCHIMLKSCLFWIIPFMTCKYPFIVFFMMKLDCNFPVSKGVLLIVIF